MKTACYVRYALVLTLFVMYSITSKCQVKDIGEMMAAGKEDAELLFQSYLSPYLNGFGAAMTGGWYNTAEAHKPGGFEIIITMNAAMVPKKFTTFDINELEEPGLQSLHVYNPLDDPNASIAPTVAGDHEPLPQLNYNLPGYELEAFEMPQGLDWRYVPAPMIQAGVGLYKGTDLLGRYLPDIKLAGVEIGMWGIGLRHDIKQWIPGIKKLPVLELSLMYGYTRLHSGIGISVEPDDIGATDNTTNISWEDQELTFLAQSHTANLLIAAKLPVITFYGGVGFIRTKTNLKLLGYYPVADFEASAMAGHIVVTDESANNAFDPIDMEIKNEDGSITDPRLNIGFRLKMSIITIHFDYTWANYSVFTAGLGVSWR